VGRRVLRSAALGIAALSLWVVAPALSTTAYVPAAVDFSQPLPAAKALPAPASKSAPGKHVAHPGEGPVSHRTGAVDAPQRFDAVGLAGELRPVEIRTRDHGGEWSRWFAIAAGDPLFVVGGADEAQLRTRGWVPSGTLHYVNVSGTTTAAQTALTSIRGAVSSAVISAGNLLAPAAKAAARPDFISRGAWGANDEQDGCIPRKRPDYGVVKAVVIHHTVTSNSYTHSQAKGIVLAICRFHRNANKWNDIGYQALTDRFGRTYEGRKGGVEEPVVGAQAQGYNAQTAGIAAIGTHSSQRVSKKTFNALAKYTAWKLERHGHDALASTTLTSKGGEVNRYPRGKKIRVPRVIPHRKLDITACPGDGLAGQLPGLRRAAQRRIDN